MFFLEKNVFVMAAMSFPCNSILLNQYNLPRVLDNILIRFYNYAIPGNGIIACCFLHQFPTEGRLLPREMAEKNIVLSERKFCLQKL